MLPGNDKTGGGLFHGNMVVPSKLTQILTVTYKVIYLYILFLSCLIIVQLCKSPSQSETGDTFQRKPVRVPQVRD